MRVPWMTRAQAVATILRSVRGAQAEVQRGITGASAEVAALKSEVATLRDEIAGLADVTRAVLMSARPAATGTGFSGSFVSGGGGGGGVGVRSSTASGSAGGTANKEKT